MGRLLRALLAAPLLAAPLLAATAASPPAPAARLFGLNAGQVSSFTTAPGGCALSILFDDFAIEWNNGGPEPKRMPARRFVLIGSAAAAGKAIDLQLRGAAAGLDRSARLVVDAGGQVTRHIPSGENFSVRIRARMRAGEESLPVTVTLDVPRPAAAGSPSLLHLDSIDVGMPACRSSKGR